MTKVFTPLLFLLPKVTYANMGIPVAAVNWASLIIFFVLVVGIEFLFLKNIDKILSKTKIFLYVFLANLKTTLLGIPIMYFFLVLVHSIIETILRDFILNLTYEEFLSNIFFALFFQPIIPESVFEIYGKTNFFIIFFFIMGVMYIPAFYLSFYIEYNSLKKWFKIDNSVLLKKICFKANLISYICLFVVASIVILILSHQIM